MKKRVGSWHASAWLAVLTLTLGWSAWAEPPKQVAAAGKGTLEIRLTGFEHSRGDVKIALYEASAADAFPDGFKRARRFIKVPIKAQRAFLSIPKLPHAVYAVSAFHDEDGDGQLNTGLFGIPTEGVGASRNPGGKPDFEDSRFHLKSERTRIHIKMTYVF